MIKFENVSLSYGGQDIFNGLNLFLTESDRTAIIGPNGSGKSTLLKMIIEDVVPSSGKVVKHKDISIGYLPQDVSFVDSNDNVLEETMKAFDYLLKLGNEIQKIEEELADLDDSSEEYSILFQKYSSLKSKHESKDGYNLDLNCKRILSGLGFSEDDYHRPVRELSGGWRMRIELAKILLQEPFLLLLDEPTNHLEMESLIWLEGYLQGHKGPLILISHDRYFLDRMVNKIIEITPNGIMKYSGNYSFYEAEKDKRKEVLESQYKNQQQKIKQEERFIERFRYKNTKAKSVQSRIKKLEKMDTVELEKDTKSISFYFPDTVKSGKIVLEVKDLCKSYGDLEVLKDVNITVERGERLAFVGINGAGKTTFSKIIAKEEPFQKGVVDFGHNVKLAYFAQHQSEILHPQNTVLEELEVVSTNETTTQLRSLLGNFLFTGDDVFKKVEVLSGGEKSRLALAKVLLKKSNFLVLDEPTNHLDIQSREILVEALKSYDGTYIIVSHDRYFLDQIVTRTIEIVDQNIKIYRGNYSYYESKKREEEERSVKDNVEQKDMGDKRASARKTREQKRDEAQLRQQIHTETKDLKVILSGIEKDIERLEERKIRIEKDLANPDFYADGQKVKDKNQEYQDVQSEIEKMYFKWDEVDSQIKAITEELAEEILK